MTDIRKYNEADILWTRCPKCGSMVSINREALCDLMIVTDSVRTEEMDQALKSKDSRTVMEQLQELREFEFNMACDSESCKGQPFRIRLGDLRNTTV